MRLARESLNWKETQDDIREAFGDEYVVMDRVDVERLRQTVFDERPNVRRLEAIIHPRVRQEVERRIVALEEEGVSAVVIDHPLLFEDGFSQTGGQDSRGDGAKWTTSSGRGWKRGA